ncbi:hypothetical protein [Sphingomonas sp. SRS2]|uniref:hypothetical protein n=1 Tax=Sphingomonas sp. SRS2 TaxID=133190 RepID=UPI00061845AC|nr:hypothetical protein [Sphingomonas sp. SRS2]KKC26026.1 hypothetical protein WP12_10395 [Sphingomonas sp. SRS2]
MSVHSVEQALWEICTQPANGAVLRGDPEAFFDGRPLDSYEKSMISELNVRGLAAYDVNQMLIMMTWNILVGPEKIGEYLARLNAPASS